jgi:ureidoacrylate peracid hydrolase
MGKRFWEWEPVFEIKPQETALLVIDMQDGFINPGAALEVPMARKQIPTIANLADFCRSKKIPVFFSRFIFNKEHTYDFYYRMAAQRGLRCDDSGNAFDFNDPESEISASLAPMPEDIVFPKYGYDCFAYSNLDTMLKEHGIKTLVVTGTVVNWCVDSTIRSAYHQNYNVVVISDAVSAYDQAGLSAQTWCDIELDLFAEAFGEVMPASALISQLS